MPQLTEQGCQARRQALMAEMQAMDVPLAVFTRSESIQWLTGVYLGPLMQPSAALDASGHLTLVLPKRKLDTPAVADQVVGYEAKWHSTMRDDQRQASLAALAEAVACPSRVAGEFSVFPRHYDPQSQAEWHDIEPILFKLRRHKYADELAMMAEANKANEKMYEMAREIIEPGVNELDLYSALQSTAVDTLGESLTYFGQDFRCAARGGAPRDRDAEAGELYILDLGVGYRGYYSDNARTIAVDGKPTDVQQAAHDALCKVFQMVQDTVKPGVSCRAMHEQVQQYLDEAATQGVCGVFNHHLGHGVGLAPHEGPHLNPFWDDTFAVGDYFTAEPGLYDEQLRAGIRLEQNYVVTEDGVQLLTDWPLNL